MSTVIAVTIVRSSHEIDPTQSRIGFRSRHAMAALDNGQPAWTWLLEHDDKPQPWFLMRLQAIEYMSEKLRAADSAPTSSRYT